MNSRSLPVSRVDHTIYMQTQKEQHPSSAKKWGLFLVLISTLLWFSSLVIPFATTLSILTVLGLLVALVGLRFHTAGLLGVGMLTTLDALTRHFLLTGGLWRWNTFNYFLLLVMGLNVIFLLRLNDSNSRLLQVFVALLTLELIISPDLSSGVQDVLNIVTMFGFVVYFSRAMKDDSSIYWLGIVAGTLSAVGSFVYFLQAASLPYINPNSWSFFPLSGMFGTTLALPWALKNNKGRFPLLMLSAINLLWIFLSGSRGTLLVGICVIIFIILMLRSISWVTLAMISGVLLWFALSAQFMEQQAYAISRLQKSFDPTQSLESRTSGRSNIAMAGWIVFLENPLGVGTGGFETGVEETEAMFSGRPAHSAWVKVLAENGIPGIIIMTAYILSFTVVGWKKRHLDLHYFFLGLLVTSVFATSFIAKEFEGKSMWLLAAGVTVIFHREAIQQALKKEEPNGYQSRRLKLLKVRYGSPRKTSTR